MGVSQYAVIGEFGGTVAQGSLDGKCLSWHFLLPVD